MKALKFIFDSYKYSLDFYGNFYWAGVSAVAGLGFNICISFFAFVIWAPLPNVFIRIMIFCFILMLLPIIVFYFKKDNGQCKDKICKCSMATSVLGDGCRYCQPQTYIDILDEYIKDLEKDGDRLEAFENAMISMCGDESFKEFQEEYDKQFKIIKDAK